jgi:hypothetical protein
VLLHSSSHFQNSLILHEFYWLLSCEINFKFHHEKIAFYGVLKSSSRCEPFQRFSFQISLSLQTPMAFYPAWQTTAAAPTTEHAWQNQFIQQIPQNGNGPAVTASTIAPLNSLEFQQVISAEEIDEGFSLKPFKH